MPEFKNEQKKDFVEDSFLIEARNWLRIRSGIAGSHLSQGKDGVR